LKLKNKLISLALSIAIIISFSSCNIASFISESFNPNNILFDTLIKEQTPAVQPSIEIDTALNPITYEERFGYNILNDAEKLIYDKIYNAVINYHYFIDLRKTPINNDSLYKIFNYFIDDQPELFWVNADIGNVYYDLDNKDIVGFNILFLSSNVEDSVDDKNNIIKAITPAAITKDRETFNSKINDILKTISPTSNELMREMKIYNYIAENIKYDYDLLAEIEEENIKRQILLSSYGAVCEKNSVCSGFSKTFQTLANYAGLQCVTKYGQYDGGLHQWNAIMIEGNYYNVDSTSPIVESKDETFTNYEFFNVTDEFISKTHSQEPRKIIDSDIIISYELPKCVETNYTFTNFFALNISKMSLNKTEFSEKIRRHYEYEIGKFNIVFPDNTSESSVEKFLSNNFGQIKSLSSKYFTLDGYYHYLDDNSKAFLNLKRKG
jgi:hypothetical protein